MRKPLFLALVFVLTLSAANFKLYLKDGSFHLVREYKVEGERVSFYSVERSDWEEIPAELVDLKKTETETAAKQQTLARESKQQAEEEEAAKEARREIQKIPRDPGVYQLEDGKLRIFPVAESTVHNAKGRNVLKALSPIPVIPGKATLELQGEHSPNVVKDPSSEFFLQLSSFESFAMVKLTPQKGFRIVEKVTIEAITKENIEERQIVPTFTKELSDNGLYKIWAQDPLPPGEYAIIEYTEAKLNPQIWDFRIQ